MSIRIVTLRGKTKHMVETYSGGKRRRQFFDRMADAEDAAASAERQRRDLGRAWDTMSPRDKAVVMPILDEIAAEGLTLTEVWRLAQEVRKQVAGGSMTLSKAVEALVAAKRQAKRSKRHVGNLEWYLGAFIKGREDKAVTSIGPDDIKAWFAERKESPTSERGHVALLSTLFGFCWRMKWISENPVTRVERVSVARAVPHVFTWRQSARAVLWVRRHKPEFLAWFALCAFCGLRPESEADRVTWDDIDLERGRIILRQTKTGRPRVLDLEFCPPALPWLRLANDLGSPLPLTPITRRRYLRKLRTEMRLERWPQDVLRHTAASNLLAHHQDAGKVAAFLGNSAGILLRHYKALVFREDAKKWMELGRQRQDAHIRLWNRLQPRTIPLRVLALKG